MEPLSILIVDDEPHALEYLLTLLRGAGEVQWKPFSAGTPAEALEIARREPIDCMITDLNLPGMDGLALIDAVHALQPSCLVVILTAYPQFETAQKAISRGVFEYVTKLDMREQLPRVLLAAAQKVNLQRESRLQQELYRQRQLSDERDFHVLLSARPASAQELRSLLNRLHFLPAAQSVYVLLAAKAGVPPEALRRALLQEPWLLNLHLQADDAQLTALLQLSAQPENVHALLEHALKQLPDAQSLSLAAVQIKNEDFCSAYSAVQRELEQRADRRFVFLPAGEPVRESGHGQLADAVTAYIQAHIAEDITLTRLSGVFGYTPNYLSAQFHKGSGERLQDHVNRQKMAFIDSLMRNRELSMNAVAQRAGFSSAASFNRFVRRNTGLPPRRYRELLFLRP